MDAPGLSAPRIGFPLGSTVRQATRGSARRGNSGTGSGRDAVEGQPRPAKSSPINASIPAARRSWHRSTDRTAAPESRSASLTVVRRSPAERRNRKEVPGSDTCTVARTVRATRVDPGCNRPRPGRFARHVTQHSPSGPAGFLVKSAGFCIHIGSRKAETGGPSGSQRSKGVTRRCRQIGLQGLKQRAGSQPDIRRCGLRRQPGPRRRTPECPGRVTRAGEWSSRSPYARPSGPEIAEAERDRIERAEPHWLIILPTTGWRRRPRFQRSCACSASPVEVTTPSRCAPRTGSEADFGTVLDGYIVASRAARVG